MHEAFASISGSIANEPMPHLAELVKELQEPTDGGQPLEEAHVSVSSPETTRKGIKAGESDTVFKKMESQQSVEGARMKQAEFAVRQQTKGAVNKKATKMRLKRRERCVCIYGSTLCLSQLATITLLKLSDFSVRARTNLEPKDILQPTSRDAVWQLEVVDNPLSGKYHFLFFLLI